MSNQRIIYTNPDGTIDIIVISPGVSAESQLQFVPQNATNIQIADVSVLPTDRMFRGAWVFSEEDSVVECPVKSKDLAHAIRRAKRAAEFAPHDDIVMKQLPGAEEAEAQRELIRGKYTVMQEDINASETVAEIRAILGE